MDATDGVIEKIKKAIRLANRTTSEAERETAMRLAKGLADKNGIAMADIEVGDGDASKAVKVDDERNCWCNGSEFGHICFILREHFGVIVMMNRYKSGKIRLSWFGSPLNIEISRHVFHILARESSKAWKAERGRILLAKMVEDIERDREAIRRIRGCYPAIVTSDRINPSKRPAFMRGFFYAIHLKLTEHPLRNDLPADKAEAERKFQEFKERNEVRTARNSKQGSNDYETIGRGMDAGRAVNLARPCEGMSTSPIALTM